LLGTEAVSRSGQVKSKAEPHLVEAAAAVEAVTARPAAQKPKPPKQLAGQALARGRGALVGC
jgi:hypothetical protein